MSTSVIFTGIAIFYGARLLNERYSHPIANLLTWAGLYVMIAGGVIYEIEGLGLPQDYAMVVLAWVPWSLASFFLKLCLLVLPDHKKLLCL